MKMTPWFSGKVKPVRKGLYICADLEHQWYDYWNGKLWCDSLSKDPFPEDEQTKFRWRGLEAEVK